MRVLTVDFLFSPWALFPANSGVSLAYCTAKRSIGQVYARGVVWDVGGFDALVCRQGVFTICHILSRVNW